MANTTEDLVKKKRSLKQYWILEIKRLYNSVYEAEWFDISKLLVDKGQATITRKLDTEAFGWGNFAVSNATFKIDNTGGVFFAPNTGNSIFRETDTRNYTKVRYSAGYYDVDGTKVPEEVFEGVLNEKTIKTNIENNTASFTALAYESLLPERQTGSAQFTGSKSIAQVAQSLLSDTFIDDFITYNGAKITPTIATTIDDSAEYNDQSLKSVLDTIAEKSNSVWYIDDTFELVITDRTATVGDPFEFVGGNTGDIATNIVKITKYDEGYSNIINYVKYDTGSNIYIESDTTANLNQYGTNELSLDGADLTNFTTIQTLSQNIISENKIPRRRIELETLYMPNVLELFDTATIQWFGSPVGADTFIWNYSNWNDDKFYLSLAGGFYLDQLTEWTVLGWQYKTGDPNMKVYLIEKV